MLSNLCTHLNKTNESLESLLRCFANCSLIYRRC